MLTVQFNPNPNHHADAATFEPPYELLGHWLFSDVQYSAELAERYLDTFRSIAEGREPPAENEVGNGFVISADREWTTVTEYYASDPKPSVRVPTPWIVDLLERWRAFLVTRNR